MLPPCTAAHTGALYCHVELHALCLASLRWPVQVFDLTNGQHFSLQTAQALMTLLAQEHQQLKGHEHHHQLQQQQQQHQEQQQANGTISSAAQACPTSNAAGVAALRSSNTAAAAGLGASVSDGRDEAAAAAGEDVMDAPDQLLQMLALTPNLAPPATTGSSPLSDSSDPTAATADGATSTAAAAAAASRQRSYDQVMQQLGVLLKAVANSPACSPGLWGLLGRWYGLQGQSLSSQEAWLKQVSEGWCWLGWGPDGVWVRTAGLGVNLRHPGQPRHGSYSVIQGLG